MNPLVQWDSPREFENGDGSKVRASTLAKLSSDLLATREPVGAAPGEPSYLTLQINPDGPLSTAVAGIAAGYVVSVDVTAPLVKTGTASEPIIGIPAASALTAGSMSIAHYNLVAAATASITEGTILIRGGSAELKGKWLETDSGTGARATVGDVRCAKDGVAAAFRNAADNGDIQLASCDTDVISHGDDSACAGHAYRVAAGGEHNFFIDGSGVVRIKYDAGKETIQFLNAGTAQIVGSTDGALKLITGSTAWVSVGLGGVGFYGNAPVAQITITQDYLDTATNVDAYAPDDESVEYDGINNLQLGEVYATVADLNATRAALENLRAAVENRMKVLNAMIDHFQLRGDFL